MPRIPAAVAAATLVATVAGAGCSSSKPEPATPTLAPPARAAVPSGPSSAPSPSIDAALLDAAGRGATDEVKRWLALGASARYTDDRQRTPLIAAAYGNHVEAARVLIQQAGADVNAKDSTQQSAYLIATSEGYADLLRLTLAHGADVKSLDSFNGTGLIRAAHHGHTDVIRELLRTSIDVNHVNRLGWTALLEAIILGDGSARYIDTVTQLLQAGADVNLADGSGVTPLQHARQRNQEAIVTILSRSGGR